MPKTLIQQGLTGRLGWQSFKVVECLDCNTYAQTTLKGAVMTQKLKCGAHARSTGQPCKAKALANGRCKNHGGMSTGPKTPEGRQAIAQATRQRMASGQRERAVEGFYRWLHDGGRDYLSSLAKERFKRLQVMRHKACSSVSLPVTCSPWN